MSQYSLADEAATLRFGAWLAGALRRLPGPEAASGAPALKIWLQGELGSGKTTLVRGLLAALGAAGAVRSPSYTLIEVHVAAPWRMVHMDLYRLRSADEVQALGLAELDAADCVWLLEWPEHAFGALPAPDLQLGLEFDGSARRLVINALSVRGRQWLEQLELVPLPY